MASFNFGLLELADGESGEAAVSVVVGKAKAEAAKKAEAEAAAAESAATGTTAEKEKAVHKNPYYLKLRYDYVIRNIELEVKSLRDVLIKLRGQQTKLKEKGDNGVHLIQLSDEQRVLRLNQLSEEQRKLRQQQKKLREEEARLRLLRKEFYLEHGFTLVGADVEEPPVPSQAESVQGNDNVAADNFNGGYNSDGYGSVPSYHDGEPDVNADGAYVYHERQVEEGYAYNNNGGRQGYPEVRKVQKWVAKKPSSDAGTEAADHKPEEKVTSDAGSEAEHKPLENDQKSSATPANADAAPTSGSEKSSAAGAASSKNRQDGSPFRKQYLNGSEKRKKRKNAKKNGGDEVDKAKKQDSSEADVSKKTDKEPPTDYPREEEQKTLAEYEKIRQEKKSSEDVSRTEQRKVSAEEFKGLQMLEKKKLDDEEAVMKAEKVQNKAKETGKNGEKAQPEAKDADAAKPKKEKVVIPLKDLSFAPPRRQVILEDGSSTGGGAPRGRFNSGGFQGRSRDNSTDSRVPAGRGGDNGRAALNEAGNYGNGASRGGYSGGRGYGSPRGDYSGGRGDGSYGAPRGDYSGGRGYGGYGAPRGDYSGRRGDGYSGGGNGGYHNQGGNGGYQGNGGYHNQGGNGGGYQRRPGNDNFYRPRGRGYSGDGRSPAPKLVVEDMNLFPPLPASPPARAAAPAAAPTAAPAPSAAAPAQS